ncbi:MetQ/NlpA family ABC transporter substrate-binding protein [Campylobacter jejuni]
MTLFTKAFCVATLFTGFAWANEELKVGSSITPHADILRFIKSALQKQGLIEVKDNELITPLDITKNPKKLKFVELKDAQLTRSLDDVDYSLINSNFAILAGLNPVKDGLYTESKYSEYGNIIAVKEGNENLPKIKALVKALQSNEVKKFIEEKYQGALIPTF